MSTFLRYISQPKHIAPLVTFRLIFGAIMFFSVIRFAVNGWIYDMYVAPKFHFTYWGFGWVKPLPEWGMYAVFMAMGISFLCIVLGWFYRAATVSAFLLFTYVELIDKTNYLNHYYFVSLVCFLLIFLPAHRYFSVDVWRKPHLKLEFVPRWTVGILKLQLGMVYFFAGIAKINPDWLLRAQPLKIWLPAHSHIPVLGPILAKPATAFFASWFGCIYDLSIPFLLLVKRFRAVAYFFVIAFHLATWLLFPIGIFPFVMMGATTIFFSASWHIKWVQKLERIFSFHPFGKTKNTAKRKPSFSNLSLAILTVFLVIQVLLPFRYALYPGKLFWTEQGYRFSWRVMLMEKAGYTTFKVKQAMSGQQFEVKNYEFLTPNQEKMMATQPDMILEYAHFLAEYFQAKGIENPAIYADSFVSLNGELNQRFIDPTVNLAEEENSLKPKSWILPFIQK